MRRHLIALTLIAVALLGACQSDNEHFCTRYQYLYQQLDDEQLLPYGELKAVLLKDIAKSADQDKRAKMMLMALEDHYAQLVQANESAKDYCMRTQRWLLP